MNLAQQTQNVASQGRYGDSMLMHVNPAEVQGLSQVMPITMNPQTGQPEAFLPFLAPLIGSLVGGSLLGGTALGTLGASALGSGLAQWAATGDIKKGLLAGITGYGIGSALLGAAGAAGASAATDAATAAATTGPMAGSLGQTATQEAIQSAATQAGGEALTAATTASPWANLKSVFSPAAISETTASAAPKLLQVGMEQAAPSFGTSMGNLATGLSQPAAMAGIAGGMAPTAVMESQEAFERQIAQRDADEEERKRQMWLDNPEPILYSAGGGNTNIDEGILMDVNLLTMAQGGRVGFQGGGKFGPDFGPNGVNTFSGDKQRFTPARQAYDINPAFMAGFQPETMYFQPNTINQPATATRAGGPPIRTDTYTGSKGGYNMPGLSIAPQQTIDPYAAYTGSAPAGLVETGFTPYPTDAPVTSPEPPSEPPIDIITPIDTPPFIPGEEIDIGDWSDPTGYDEMIDTGVPMDQYGDPIEPTAPSFWNNPAVGTGGYGEPDIYAPYIDNDFTGEEAETLGLNIPSPMSPELTMPPVTTMQPPVQSPMGLTPEELETGAYTPAFDPNLGSLPIAPPMDQQPVMQSPEIPQTLGGMGLTVPPPSAIPDMPSIAQITPDMLPTLSPDILALAAEQAAQTQAAQTPDKLADRNILRRERISRSAKGGRTGYQNQGMTEVEANPVVPQQQQQEMMNDPLTQEAILFIVGESDNQQAVNNFISKYGNEMFMQLRDTVLKQIAGADAQTEGQIVGEGGGMGDEIPGTIGANEKIAVSPDEFIVPADVVAGLGDGSSNAGSDKLYEMMDRVRQAKTGGRTQPPRIDLNKVMPA